MNYWFYRLTKQKWMKFFCQVKKSCCLAHCMSLSLSLLHKFSFDIISSFFIRDLGLFLAVLSLSFSAAVLPSYSLVSNVFILICLPALTSTQDKAKTTKEKIDLLSRIGDRKRENSTRSSCHITVTQLSTTYSIFGQGWVERLPASQENRNITEENI